MGCSVCKQRASVPTKTNGGLPEDGTPLLDEPGLNVAGGECLGGQLVNPDGDTSSNHPPEVPASVLTKTDLGSAEHGIPPQEGPPIYVAEGDVLGAPPMGVSVLTKTDGGSAEDATPPPERQRLDVAEGDCLGGQKTIPVLVDLENGQWGIKFQAQIRNDVHDVDRINCLRAEIEIFKLLNSLDHSHAGYDRIIQMCGFTPGAQPTLTLELIEPFGFDMLVFFIKCVKTKTPVDTPLLAHVFKQLCDALEYIQFAKVVHGDIKCENVLITRGADIKVIDFGCASKWGTEKNWPGYGEAGKYWSNIAPEVVDKRVAADYPQDTFGLSEILLRYSFLPGNLPGPIAETLKSLQNPDPELRMTLENLKTEPWLREAATKPQSLLGEVKPGISKVPLALGFKMMVTSGMSKQLGRQRCTIGSAKLMQEGVHVLYVERNSTAMFEPGDRIVHVPGPGTEVFEGDWLYFGFPDRNSASKYFQMMATRAEWVEDNPTVFCVRTYFFFDEVPIPHFADNYAVGPPLKAVEPQYRAGLMRLYEKIRPPPAGYLHLRRNFGINLAGVRRGDKLLFFPGPDFVVRKDDIALFVRAVGPDGNHEATHPPDLIKTFTTKSEFDQRALKSEDIMQPLGMKDVILRKEQGRECTFWAKVCSDGKNAIREEAINNEVKFLKLLTLDQQGDASPHTGRSRIIRLLHSSEGKWSPTSMTLELVKPFGFDVVRLMDAYKKKDKGMDLGTLAHLFGQLVEALQYMKSKSIVHGSLCCSQLLVTRKLDIKVMNFYEAAVHGEMKMWPTQSHMAPEVGDKWVAADFAQDIYGAGWVLQELTSSVAQSCWEVVQETMKSLLAAKPERATHDTLVDTSWLSDRKTPAPMMDVEQDAFLLPGISKQVDSEVLKLGRTIGAAKFMERGLQVLYVDQRSRDPTLLPDDPIVRVPLFSTEIAKGDWLYCGVATRHVVVVPCDPEMVAQLDDDAHQPTEIAEGDMSEKLDALSVLGPKQWIPSDEWPLPRHWDGHALGPDPEEVPTLKDRYSLLRRKPIGFLNLRNRYHINLAGVRRAGQEYLFPGPDFVIQDGDIGLLARVEEPDGHSYSAYQPEYLRKFHDEALGV